ncbi:RING finger protein 32-like isoform X2 [Amia ocellicauda]|uniref:RING finger protein 32 isoform X2 n=1 Tax=Amia ocellicauda TaxID=2972642 RepID=UPI003463950C
MGSKSHQMSTSCFSTAKGTGRKPDSRQWTVVAAALQDHMSRSLQLHRLPLPEPVKWRCHNRQGTCTDKCHEKAPGNTGIRHRAPPACDGEEMREYVLDPRPPAMTLAQKLGLVEAPAEPLSADQWELVKDRSVQQGDSAQPCAICREEFRLQSQVLLSCSHVFHRVCLQAFERFSGQKSCPMCRKQQYETRVIHDGACLYRGKCAARIQACWRGYIVRKWYRHLRKTVPPRDAALRRTFFEDKLRELNDRLVQSCNTDVEEFLSGIDASVVSSRRVLCQLDSQHASGLPKEEWEKIQAKAFQRDTHDCPICLTPLCGPSLGEAGLAPRTAVLLSCSHLFHLACLEAFELFCLEEEPGCPLCRSPYQKRVL